MAGSVKRLGSRGRSREGERALDEARLEGSRGTAPESVMVKDLVAAGSFGECCDRLLSAVHLPSTGEITSLLSLCLMLVSSRAPSKLFDSLLQVLSCTLSMSKQPTVSVLYNSPLFVAFGFVSLLGFIL